MTANEHQKVDVEKIAEVVLYEGYLLFPYRRSALKNQQRWTFGGVYPRQYSEATGEHDPWQMQTQCLVQTESEAETEFEIKLRFLHVCDRHVREDTDGTSQFVDRLQVGEQVHRPWEEAIERTFVLDNDSNDSFREADQAKNEGQAGARLPLADLLKQPLSCVVEVPAGSTEEVLYAADGTAVGALVRAWRRLRGEVEVSAETVGATFRLTVRIVNTTPCNEDGIEDGIEDGTEIGIDPATIGRSDIIRRTFVSTHTILRVEGGAFISLLETPDVYRDAAQGCTNIKTWPVLVGMAGERHTLLSSPILLYDYPQVSPQSYGNYFDATEIDELLALTVLTLTDDEKLEMGESDHRAREILERTEGLSEAQLLELHAVLRS